MTTRVLDVQAGILMRTGADTPIPYADLTWMSVLRVTRRRPDVPAPGGRGGLRARRACASCSQDPPFPRSVEHCLIEISRLAARAAPPRDRPMAAICAVRPARRASTPSEVGLGRHPRLRRRPPARASADSTTSSRPPTSAGARDAESRATVMSIHVALEHRTALPVRPRRSASARTSCACGPPRTAARRSSSYSLTVEPSDHFLNWQQDPFGNFVARLVFPEKASELSITVDLVADMTVINPFDFFLERAPSASRSPTTPTLRRDLAPVPRVPIPSGRCSRRGWPRSSHARRTARPSVDFLVELNQRLAARHRLHDPHGAGRADARGDAGPGARLVP